jgi:very-short-patch-repair endonuclease
MSWDGIAVLQHGTISRSQLRSVGQTDRSIGRLTEQKQLWTVLDGVFLVRGAPLTYAARMWAAVLRTEGVVGFESAGHHWGQLAPQPKQVHICVAHPVRSHSADWITLHRVDVPLWGRTTCDELPITTISWTLLDLVGDAKRDSDASMLLDRGLQQGWISLGALDRRLAQCPNRYGNGRLRRFKDQLDDGASAKSERLLHRILKAGGVKGWRPNFKIELENRQIAYLDVAFPHLRLAIEIDGWAHHSDVDRFRGDRTRQNALVSLGWTVLRFTWADLTERPEYVLATIANFGAQVDAG